MVRNLGGREMKEPRVYKSNSLVEARYRLSVAEQRILLACMSRVRRDRPITDDVLYSVTASEIAELSGTSTKQAYRELEKASLRLKRRDVRLVEEPNGKGKKSKVMITGWVQTIIYIESEGRVEIRFTKDMLPYLSQLTEQFTNYALSDIARMTSIHAIRIYEMLIQWQSIGKREFSIEWLRSALMLEDKYPSFKNFRRRVIEPAEEQINNYSPIKITWELRKTGRKFSHITFNILENKSETTKNSVSNDRLIHEDNGNLFGIPSEVIRQHARLGEDWYDAALRVLELKKRHTN